MFGKKKPAEKKSTARKPTAKKVGGKAFPTLQPASGLPLPLLLKGTPP